MTRPGAMADVVIRLENVGKKYRLGSGHDHAGPYRQPTLRETLTEATVRLFHRRNEAQRREELWALRDVSFEVNQGEVIGIIGRNGAGKSTLLKLLSRITEPTTGKVRIKGRVASLLEVGTGFHPELTGRENVYLNGAILGMTRAEIQRKFDQIVDFAEVHQFLDTAVKYYSSGMYLRLAFAVAAHLDPEILLMDEVLAVGDAEFQKKCLGKMDEVSRSEGRTILFVSHQMMAVERLCNRVLLIEKGRIRMESADVRAVVGAYLSGKNNGAASRSAEWRNSGNQFNNAWFEPERFFLAEADGTPLTTPVRVDTDIWLYVVADFKRLDPALMVGFGAYTESGELLYESYHTDTSEAEWPRLRLGRAVLRTRILPRLLNQGTYRFDLLVALYYREWLFAPGGTGPSVFLELQGSLSDSPLWPAKRPSVLAPVIGWELCVIGE